MIVRRTFLGAALTGLAAPFIIRSSSRAANLRVRRDVMELPDNDPFFKKYGEAVRAMHNLPDTDGRNWIRQAKVHADFCKHGELSFLQWHRHYINFFEAICGELIGDPEFSLPYWNWSKKSGVIPAPFYNIQELNVEFWNDPGAYSGQAWGSIDTVARRGLTKGRGLLDDPLRGGSFTSAKIDSIKNFPTANLFRSGLEGSPHNDGHVVSGATAAGKRGHIGSGLSPLDPIFWLHHCMVDRVWAEWQKTHTTPDPGETYENNFVDRKGTQVIVTSAGAQMIAPLGYTYDVLQPSPVAVLVPGGSLLTAIAPDLEKTLAATPAVTTLGSASNADISVALIETAIKVSTPNVAGAVASDRPFKRFSQGREVIGVERSRTLARLSDVQLKSAQDDLVVNVFVNCPYLSPSTGYIDPHYAGTFSFFGGTHAGHGGAGREFIIDITAPVQSLANEGRIKNEELTIQLMPLPAYMEGSTDASFRTGKVEIIAF